MESAVQHGAAAFVAGLQATGAEGNPAQARGAWGCGKRSAFPTSPHPRRRLRTNFKRGATLTIYLVQKIGQVNPIAEMRQRVREECAPKEIRDIVVPAQYCSLQISSHTPLRHKATFRRSASFLLGLWYSWVRQRNTAIGRLDR